MCVITDTKSLMCMHCLVPTQCWISNPYRSLTDVFCHRQEEIHYKTPSIT